MKIETLCKKYTNLKEKDIERLNCISQVLPLISDLINADVFLDVSTRDYSNAIVLAEGFCEESLYKQSVVGEIASRKNEPAVLRTLETGVASKELKAVTQENIKVRQNVIPIKNDESKVIGTLIMEKDITDDLNNQKQFEILSETTEQLTQAFLMGANSEGITQYVNEGIIIFDENGTAIYCNPIADKIYKTLGYKDDVKGMKFGNLALSNKSFEEILNKAYISEEELEIGPFCLKLKYSSIYQNSKVVSLVMLIKDITEVKEIEKELILKSVAIKEIHHRVKNNLQTIASLLRLQSRRIGDETVRVAFNESISRILSISLTHEILAQNGVDCICIKEILTKLVNNTLNFSKNGSVNIVATVEGDEFNVDSDKATSIGLVVNELLQNAIEYAFVGREEGNIKIEIIKDVLYSKIIITDDGIGFNKEDIRSGSLGYSIVKGIVSDKLNGEFEVDSSSKGTKVTFDFKNE